MMKLEAGYKGKDTMRSKAERMADKHLNGMMEPPQSMTSKSREKTRLYKEGGHSIKTHRMSAEQTDMKIPRLAKTPKLNIENMSKVENKGYRRGGHKHKFADGGIVQDSSQPLSQANRQMLTAGAPSGFRDTSLDGAAGRSFWNSPQMQQMRQSGGRGMSGMGIPYSQEPWGPLGGMRATQDSPSMRQPQQNPMMGGMAMSSGSPSSNRFSTMPVRQNPPATMKEGGRAYAKGGSVAEHRMVGEKPSHKQHHFNYESSMKGMHGSMKAKVGGKPKGHRCDESEGQIYKKGYRGSDTPSKMHTGGSASYAIGGTGKLRKGQMTSSPQQMMKKDDESHRQNRAKGGHTTFAAARTSYEKDMMGEHGGHMGGTHGVVSKKGRNDESKGQIHRPGAGQRSDMHRGGRSKGK